VVGIGRLERRTGRTTKSSFSPGKPVQNAYVESFNGRLRDEMLERELAHESERCATKIETWRQDYNQQRRPHSSLDYLTPAEFARTRAEMLGIRKARTALLEQGTQAPSPAPDLIPAENKPANSIGNSHSAWYNKRGAITSNGPLTPFRWAIYPR
jgi:hypothetical protein